MTKRTYAMSGEAMQLPKERTAMRYVLAIFLVLGFSGTTGAAQSPAEARDERPIKRLFDELDKSRGESASVREKPWIRLLDSIGTIPAAQITEGLPLIDQVLDNNVEPVDRTKKGYAALLLMFIGWRADGYMLLSSQIDRLTIMLNDPSHVFTGPAASALQHIAIYKPDLVVPILKAALQAPGVNNSSGMGPGIATTLLRITANDDVAQSIVSYMRRSDLTDEQLVDLIIGIDSSPIIPDAVCAELVRALDRGNEFIDLRALEGIGKSSPAARTAACARLQRLAADAHETTQTRQAATKILAVQNSGR